MFSLNEDRGFTFIELCVIFVIMAILITIGYHGFRGTQGAAATNEMNAILRAIWNAEQDYYAFKYYFTGSFADLSIDSPNSAGGKFQYCLITVPALEIVACDKFSDDCYRMQQDGNPPPLGVCAACPPCSGL